MRMLYITEISAVRYSAVSREILTLKNTSAGGVSLHRGPKGMFKLKKTKRARALAISAVIAAMYAVLTYVAAAMNLAFGPVQFRFSEALTVLPVFTPAAIPGLAIGCLISNLASPLGIVDWIFGTTATLCAAVCTYGLRNVCVKKVPLLAPLPPVVFNALLVGFEIACLSEGGTFSLANLSFAGFLYGALSVGIGELVVCYVLGLPLLSALRRTKIEEKLHL